MNDSSRRTRLQDAVSCLAGVLGEQPEGFSAAIVVDEPDKDDKSAPSNLKGRLIDEANQTLCAGRRRLQSTTDAPMPALGDFDNDVDRIESTLIEADRPSFLTLLHAVHDVLAAAEGDRTRG